MTFRDLWQLLTPRYDNREAQAIIRLLLESFYGLTLTDIITFSTDRLDEQSFQQLQGAMRRLKDGEPVQYVLGHETFCGHLFRVGPGVLIPRPETESLVSLIDYRCGCRLLDIGTGSGCIAISAKLEHRDMKVSAWDISPDALDIARENARTLGADVDFRHADMLCPPHDGARWDIIVSNPPYICEKEKAAMEHNVLDFEPSGALFVPDDDPLKFYKAIAEYASQTLCEGGQLCLECNPLYIDDTARMIAAKGLRNIIMRQDQFGKKRFITAMQS